MAWPGVRSPVTTDRLDAFRRLTGGACHHRYPKGGCDACARATWILHHGGGPPLVDTAAEEAVVASCLVDADAVVLVHATGLVADDMHHVRTRYGYAAVRAVAEARGRPQVYVTPELRVLTMAPVNEVTVAHALAGVPAEDGRRSRLDAVGGMAWLSEIVGELPTSTGAAWYAEIVRECAERRRVVAAAEAARGLAVSGAVDAGARARALFEGVSDGGKINGTRARRWPPIGEQ